MSAVGTKQTYPQLFVGNLVGAGLSLEAELFVFNSLSGSKGGYSRSRTHFPGAFTRQ